MKSDLQCLPTLKLYLQYLPTTPHREALTQTRGTLISQKITGSTEAIKERKTIQGMNTLETIHCS